MSVCFCTLKKKKSSKRTSEENALQLFPGEMKHLGRQVGLPGSYWLQRAALRQ